MQIVLLVLVGGPAAGKTYFAEHVLADERLNQQYKCIHICYDKLLLRRDYHISPPMQWKVDRMELFQKVSTLLKSLRNANSENIQSIMWDGQSIVVPNNGRLVVIIDDNMYYRSMRLSYYHLAQNLNCGFCQVYFKTSLEEALKANANRDACHRVDESTIRKMFTSLDIPNKKSKWEENTICINSFGEISSITPKLIDLLELAAMQPECLTLQPHNTVVQQIPSVLHNVDIALRLLVGKIIREYKGKLSPLDMKDFSNKLTQEKNVFMNQVKVGNVPVTLETVDDIVEREFLLRVHNNMKLE